MREESIEDVWPIVQMSMLDPAQLSKIGSKASLIGINLSKMLSFTAGDFLCASFLCP